MIRLGIVGHGQEKFTVQTEFLARTAILKAIQTMRPTAICSGRSPMGGVDTYAEEIAYACGVPFQPFGAQVNSWNPAGRYGYKARNLDIAKFSDVVLCVVVRELPPGFAGWHPGLGCYHCAKHDYAAPPQHIKSGGCWTAWKCKNQRWAIV